MARIEKHILFAAFDVLGTRHRKGLTVTIPNLVLHLKIFVKNFGKVPQYS